VPIDVPLYSKSTGLPIFRMSDDLPIFGDPANCGCCGAGPEFDSGCSHCAAGKTPLALEVTFSGVTPCTFCGFSLWGGPPLFRWKSKSALNDTYQLVRGEDPFKCTYTAETIWTWEKYAYTEADECTGEYLGDVSSPCYITVQRINETQWLIDVWGEWPNFGGQSVKIFRATKTEDCDVSWVVDNWWDFCYWTIPQDTTAFIYGSASVEPV